MDNNIGIDITFSSWNNISYNDIENTTYGYGVRIHSCTNHTIKNNNISGGSTGIYLWSSDTNHIANNNATDNAYDGLRLFSSDSNIIENNIFLLNENGINILSSFDNIIYHNNILDNANQSFDLTNMGNMWDNGYPSGGNYWSDYSGVDNFKGPNQDIPGSDGIGDTPYIIDVDSQDNYPLMEPFTDTTFENYTVLKQGWN